MAITQAVKEPITAPLGLSYRYVGSFAPTSAPSDVNATVSNKNILENVQNGEGRRLVDDVPDTLLKYSVVVSEEKSKTVASDINAAADDGSMSAVMDIRSFERLKFLHVNLIRAAVSDSSGTEILPNNNDVAVNSNGNNNKSTLAVGSIAGIVIGILALVILVGVILGLYITGRICNNSCYNKSNTNITDIKKEADTTSLVDDAEGGKAIKKGKQQEKEQEKDDDASSVGDFKGRGREPTRDETDLRQI